MTMRFDKLFIKKNKQKIIYFLMIFFSCAVLSLSSASFFNSRETRVFAISNSISKQSRSNISSKAFSLIKIEDENAKNIINGVFNSEYSSNFNGGTELMTYVDSSGSLYNFDLKCGNSYLLNSKWCDLNTYSNQVEFKRFEKININLYKTPNKNEEINNYGTDGFIYIPDYFADQIIEESDGELSTYDSLIPDLSSIPVDERNNFLEKYCVRLTNPKGVIEKYKISNIFHVDGFMDDNYVYNDSDSRILLKHFLGNYAFIHSNIDSFQPTDKALLTIIEGKRFVISERISSFLDYQSVITFYKVHGSGFQPMISENEQISDIVLNKKDINVFCLSACIVCFLSFLTILILSYKKSIFISLIFYLAFLSSIVFVSLSLQIFSLTIFSTNIIFYQLYNIGFNIFLLLIVAAFTYFYFLGRMSSNEKNIL